MVAESVLDVKESIVNKNYEVDEHSPIFITLLAVHAYDDGISLPPIPEHVTSAIEYMREMALERKSDLRIEMYLKPHQNTSAQRA